MGLPKRAAAMAVSLMLMLVGCGGQKAGSPALAPLQGPGMERPAQVETMRESLSKESLPAQVKLWPEGFFSGSRVEVTPQLLQNISYALYYGGGEWVKDADGGQDGGSPPVPPAEGKDPVLELSAPGEGLSLSLRGEADGCTALLQTGGETVQLAYPRAVYEYVLHCVEENLVEDTVALAGKNVPLQSSGPADGELASCQWLECAAGLAGLYTWYDGGEESEYLSALEIFDPATGESLYFHEIGAQALRMEAASFGACDMRVMMSDGAVWYLNSQNPEVKPYYFYLPKNLRGRLLAAYPNDRPVFRSFDGGTGQGAVWAVVDEEGITWARRSKGATISNDVILENIPGEWLNESSPPPQFGEVRLMNGGSTLVATVVRPGGQIGEAGLFTYQISSGKMSWHFGMFQPVLADLRFLDDTHLVVAGQEEIFHLNIASGKESTTPSPKGIATSATPDYEHYVFTASQLNPDGTTTAALYTEDPEKPLLSATSGGDGLWVRGITPRYLIAAVGQEGGWYLAQWG